MVHSWSTRFILIAGTGLVAACANMAPAVDHELYPGEFSEGRALNSRMQQLGLNLQELDMALLEAHDERPDLQQQIIGLLQDIERIAATANAAEIPADHPFLQADMSAFLADVRAAREDVSGSAPRYYRVGRLSGACINCHRSNR